MYCRRLDLKGSMPCFLIFIVFLSASPLYGQHQTTQKNACCPGQPDYDLLYGLRDETGRIAGWNDPVAGFIERRAPENTVHAIGQGLSLGVMPELKVVGNVGKIFGFGRKAAGKGIQVLRPLGRGSTGRAIANTLEEQLALKEVLANPNIGKIIIIGLADGKWQGWHKLQYVKILNNKSKIVIHYVGKFEDGVLISVDDFKFK